MIQLVVGDYGSPIKSGMTAIIASMNSNNEVQAKQSNRSALDVHEDCGFCAATKLALVQDEQ